MKPGLRILAGLLLATVFTLSVLLFRRPPDPVYRAKCASEWAEDLLSPDYTVRNEAQTAFQFFGEDGVPQLRVLLQRRNRPWGAMLAQMNQYAPFFDYKNYDSVLSRQRGAEMTGLLGGKAKEAIPDLIAALAGEQIANEAERALMRIGKSAEVPLQAALRNKNPEIRERAAGLLKEFEPISESTIAALLHAARDQETRVRKRVAFSLGEIRKADRNIDSDLLRLADDSADPVRSAAFEALGKRMVQGSAVRKRMLRALSDPAVIVRLEAARAFWRTTGETSTVVPTLISILPTSEGWQAAYTLADIGRSASPAVPELVKALRKERVPRPYRTPPSSAFALGHIGAAAIPRLSEALKDRDSRVRISAVMAFGFMGQEARPAVPSLMNLLNDGDAEVRHTTALTLANIGGADSEKIISGLSDCLCAEDIYMRSAAADRLREIDPKGNWVASPE